MKLNYKILENIAVFSLYLFVFFLPWQTILILKEVFIDGYKWHYGTIGIYISDVFLLLSFIFTTFFTNPIKINRKVKNLIYLLSLFAIYTLLSSYWALEPSVSIFFSIKFLLGILLIIIIQKLNIKNYVIYTILTLSVVIQGIIGIYQFSTQNTFSQKYLGMSYHNIWEGGNCVLTSETGRWLRNYGPQAHPNIFAMMLAVSLLLSILLYINKTSKNKKIITLISIPILTMNILLTFSRSIWLGLFLCFIIFLIILKKEKKKKLIHLIAIIIITSIITISLYKDLFFVRITHDTNITHNSLLDRKTYLKQSKEMFTSHKLFGVGIGNFTNYAREIDESKKPIWNYQPVHNIPMLISSELGIIGIFLSVFIFLSFVLNILELKKTKKLNDERKIIIITLTLLLIISFFDHLVVTSHTGLFVLFLLIGLIIKQSSTHHFQ